MKRFEYYAVVDNGKEKKFSTERQALLYIKKFNLKNEIVKYEAWNNTGRL
jgi:hypothetical protein